MSTSNDKMKWILFTVFIILFVLAVLGTLGVVFFNFGTPTDRERELLVTGLILEVAACVIALFYSIFGLTKTEPLSDERILTLEKRVEELEKESNKAIKKIDEPFHAIPASTSGDSTIETNLTRSMHPSVAAIEDFNIRPAFPKDNYSLSPSATEITNDIASLKPFDREHRANSYIGLKVQWKCAFLNFEERPDHYLVCVHTEKPHYMARILVAKTEDISKLKILNEHHPLWIAGEISKVDTLFIKLVNGLVSV
jgi:flagellar basal body-associated protein FliL